MSRSISLLVAFSIAAALALGVLVAGRSALQTPEVAGAIARQEEARAAQLQAQAWAEQAAAERAWLDLDTARQAQPVIVNAIGVTLSGAALALVVVLVGGAIVALSWAWRRAHVIYPTADGRWPIVYERHRGGALVLDLSRLLGPALLATGDGEIHTQPHMDAGTQLQISTQAQASAALVGLASKAAGVDAVKRIDEVSKHAPLPTFAQSSDGVRMIYVRDPKQTTEQSRDLADLRELITSATTHGLARRYWLSRQLRSGHRMTRARYDALIAQLQRAGVIEHDQGGQSWQLAVSESEALDAFGCGDRDDEGEQNGS